MKPTLRFLSASMALALAFTFSCSSDDSGGGGGNPPEGGTSSPGIGDDKSSSSTGNVRGSSSSIGSTYDGPYGELPYEGKTYKTVVIDAQTWMAENLDYAVEGSKCYGEDGVFYDYETLDYITLTPLEVQANCDKYGRLYNWVTAMDLPSSCETTSCASQIDAKHRGICPKGWHIPSSAEWDALSTFIVRDKGCGRIRCEAKHLKTASGWNNDRNGLNSYGFAALPGGIGQPGGGRFEDVGSCGFWWSSKESNNYIDEANYNWMFDESANWIVNRKSFLVSVRCVKD